MNSTIDALLKAIQAGTGFSVQVGFVPPNQLPQATIHIWPWRFSENASLRLPHESPGEPPQRSPAMIHCLVTAADLSGLEQVRAALQLNPVLAMDDQRVLVQQEALAVETLLGLFAAAQLAPRACLAYVLESEG